MINCYTDLCIPHYHIKTSPTMTRIADLNILQGIFSCILELFRFFTQITLYRMYSINNDRINYEIFQILFDCSIKSHSKFTLFYLTFFVIFVQISLN